MYLKQIYTACFSEAAYFLESNGEAAVIDPMRDTEVYLKLAQQQNAKIKYIFETHFHSDFVSGHLDLSKKTGPKLSMVLMQKQNFHFTWQKMGKHSVLVLLFWKQFILPAILLNQPVIC